MSLLFMLSFLLIRLIPLLQPWYLEGLTIHPCREMDASLSPGQVLILLFSRSGMVLSVSSSVLFPHELILSSQIGPLLWISVCPAHLSCSILSQHIV